MHFALSSEQQLFRRLVRDFCDAELAPRAAEIDREARLHWPTIQKMAAIGLLGLQIDEEYGGAALDTLSASIAIEEIARACGSTALSVSAHNGLGAGPIQRWGTPEQRQRYLPRLTSGEYLGALALTEPGAGTDLAGGVQTRAVVAGNSGGDSWIVNGQKAWITNVSHAVVVVTLVRSDAAAGTRGFSMLLIEPGTDGFTVHPPERKMGVRGSPTHMLSFENVRIPLSATLGARGRGFHQTMQTLDAGRISIAALCVGLAQGAYEQAARYALERQAFGKPIARHQLIQAKIAEAATEIEAARLLVYAAAWRADEGLDFSKQAAMAKLKASEVAERVCHDAIQIHGSYGYSAEFPVERIYRDQRLMTIGEGTSEIQRLVIARRALAEFQESG